MVESSIHTLISDIHDLVGKKDGRLSEDLCQSISQNIARSIRIQYSVPKLPSLRMSGLGIRCPRALWYSIHKPELAEPLPPWTEVKFTFGHTIEAIAIGFAKAAGHRVEGEQDELTLDGVKGHRDCVIDGCVVDVKSASSRSYQKFKTGSIEEDDLFGYLEQLDAYVLASREDPLVTVKDKGYLLAIDKQLGHMCIHEHILREEHIISRIKDYKRIVSFHSEPRCECGVEQLRSGNVQLDTRASYSNFKFSCFPGLRCFIYSDGPRYLAHVEKRPYDTVRKRYIPEVDRAGNFV